MADIQSVTWSETASSNNAAPADGWPEGQSYASVNNCAREMMGALKREWNRSHPTLSTAGTSTALTLTYTTAPTLVQGIQFAFRLNQDMGAAATLNVNGLGATSIYKQTVSGTAAVLANDFRSGQLVVVQYDTTAGGFIVISPNPKVGLHHIQTYSIAAGTSVVLTLPSQFTNYRIMGTGVIAKTSTRNIGYVHSANSVSFSSSANDYTYGFIYVSPAASGTASSNQNTGGNQAIVVYDTNAGSGAYFDILYNTTSANGYGHSMGKRNNSGSPYSYAMTFLNSPNANTGTIQQLKFVVSGGASFSGVGSITVHGIAEGV